MIFPLNHDPEGVIDKQLYKLKKYSLSENVKNVKSIKNFTKYVAKIHTQSIKDQLKKYDAEWVAEQTKKIEDVQYKNGIVSALKIMSQVEVHNALPKEISFLAWDVSRSDWQQNYKSGGIGSYIWDIACIINIANDSQFSDAFLTSYLRYGGEKPTLATLYANLYYVRVVEATKNKNFENIIEITRKILENGTFYTDIISYDTLIELGIAGY